MTHPQTSSFVPLVAAMPSAEKREFQITVIPQTEQASSFQSFEKTSASANEWPSSKKNCEPQLSVQREGDRVTSIRIQCSCGQTIDLACLYDPPAKAKENNPPVPKAKQNDPAAKAEQIDLLAKAKENDSLAAKAEQGDSPAKAKQSDSPAKVKRK